MRNQRLLGHTDMLIAKIGKVFSSQVIDLGAVHRCKKLYQNVPGTLVFSHIKYQSRYLCPAIFWPSHQPAGNSSTCEVF